jgi:indolepyruvate ferredoxin oxidoreductase beta subunit
MSEAVKQQIVISGVGGQGVLFVTRLLAEAAISKGMPVTTSETHGMAQRGGTVLSHFKVGDYASPLIRPAQADGLLVLKAENMAQHGAFLRSGGWVALNAGADDSPDEGASAIDADTIASKIDNPKSVNLVLLGYALAVAASLPADRNPLFCNLADIQDVLNSRFGSKAGLLEASLGALQAGYDAA